MKVLADCAFEPLMVYCNGAVPPDMFRVTLPLLPLLHETGVELEEDTIGPG